VNEMPFATLGKLTHEMAKSMAEGDARTRAAGPTREERGRVYRITEPESPNAMRTAP
jgi:hypothetical protein